MLQKVPLHIASTEANLKETIRKFVVAPDIASFESTSTGSVSDPRKRKPSRNTEQLSPSPSVTKRRRIRIETSCTKQQQLPSPQSSRDSLLARNGLPTTNQHHSIGDALRSGSRSASRSINTAQIPNPGQRSSIQQPTPRIIQTTPSRKNSVALSDRSAQPTSSSVSHKKGMASDTFVAPHFARPISSAHSVTQVPPNRLDRPNDAFNAPSHIHTPLRTGSKHPNDWSARPSALPPPSIGFSAVRRWLARQPLSVHS